MSIKGKSRLFWRNESNALKRLKIESGSLPPTPPRVLVKELDYKRWVGMGWGADPKNQDRSFPSGSSGASLGALSP